jgi:hypothetical protein
MTKRTRYFMAGSAAVGVVGLCTGLVAFYTGGFQALSASTGPIELAYVPADATVVAYADVRGIMDSQLRLRLKQALPIPESGQQEFQEQTGIDIERDIDYVVAAMIAGGAVDKTGLVIARGRFDDARLEKLATQHGAEVTDYKGKRLLVLDKFRDHHESGDSETVAAPRHVGVLAFLEPGLVGIGELRAIHSAIDSYLTGQSVTSNNEMMELVSEIELANNAWAVGRFDVLASQAKLPEQVARQIPAVKWFAAAGHINGGVVGTLRAEARDEQAAENLRDVVRGFLALARMQTQTDPKFAALSQSLELTGAGKTVSLSFMVPAELFQLMAPHMQGQ